MLDVRIETFHFHLEVDVWKIGKLSTRFKKKKTHVNKNNQYWICLSLCVVSVYTSEFSSTWSSTPELHSGRRIPSGWTCLLVFMSEQILRWWWEEGRKTGGVNMWSSGLGNLSWSIATAVENTEGQLQQGNNPGAMQLSRLITGAWDPIFILCLIYFIL